MKDIERIFKEALDQHEVPYQSGAWEAMSKRLDGTTPTPFYRKWWFAATVGTVLVSSSTYFMLREQATKPAEQTTQTTVNPTVSNNETAAPLADNQTTNTTGSTSNTSNTTSGTLVIDPVTTPEQSTTTVPVDNATNKTTTTNPHKGTTPNPATPTPTTPKTPIEGERPAAGA